MRPPALFIKLAIIIFWIFRSLGWAEESQDTPITLDLFPSSQIEPSPPLIDENKFASLLRPSALFNMAGNAIAAEYIEGRPRAGQLKSLWSNEEMRGLLKTLSTSKLADGRSVDAGYSPFNTSPNGFTEQQRRLFPFGLKGAWGDFDYGAEYRSLGKGFGDLARPQLASDQTNGELWAQQKFGVLNVKASVSEFSNNVEENPAIPLVTTVQGGMTMDVTLPSWPLFSLFYYRGSSASSSEPGVLRPGETSWETVGTSLHYGTSLWEATLSSTYSLNIQGSRSGSAESFSVPASANSLYFSSSKTQTETQLVSLGLTYRLLAGRLAITSFGSYSKTRSADGFTNASTINASNFLVWQLERTSAGEKTLSIGTTFNSYLDAIGPGTSYKDFAVWVRLKIAIF